ncbi:hypothetical protein TNCV_2943871 [Trichonephila clavipes]|nr:hypothetical protein TNCV_2943871 [Trichonephila clavipes]
MLYSDASGVEHTDSEPHNSSNKSSGRMNRRSPYSKPPDAFMCGERPKEEFVECVVPTVWRWVPYGMGGDILAW